MKLVSSSWENYETLLREDFGDISGPLEIDLSDVEFFTPPTLTLLYAIFRRHQMLYPQEKRICRPPVKEDTVRYMQRMNFFYCCNDFSEFTKEPFSRHESQDRFIPIIHLGTNDDTDKDAERIVRVIFSDVEERKGEGMLKTILTELIDNSKLHSGSGIGTLCQVQKYEKSKSIWGIILDVGIGIRSHIMGNLKIRDKVKTDRIAIEYAMEPGISGTHDTKSQSMSRERSKEAFHHWGYGLPKCGEIMRRSGGFMHVISGDASLKISDFSRQWSEIGGWQGTMVVFKMGYQKLVDIGKIVTEFDERIAVKHTISIPFK